MSKKDILKKVAAGVLTVALAVALTACKNSSAAANSSGSSSSGSTEKIKISVGIGNATTPFCYLDENGSETGYDYEVLKAVAKQLSGKYQFTFNPDAFANLLIGLDTKKYNIAVNHFGYTDQRAQNYLYAKVADMYYGNFQIGVKKGRKDITDMKGLAGKTVVAGAGSMAETLVKNWNTANPSSLIKIANSSDKDIIHSGIESGLYDAFVGATYDLKTLNKQYDNYLDIESYKVTPDTYNSGTYFIYSKGSDELQQDIDAALQKLIDNGTLLKLSQKWLGGDYTKNPNATTGSGK